jgi:DNA processing protein
MIPKFQLISLSAVPGMGPRRIRTLLRKFPKLEDITKLSKSDLMLIEGISSDLAAKTKGIDLELDKMAEDKTASIGARYLTYWDSSYPEHLKTIYDAPVGIFVIGEIPQLPCLGIVGTRQPSHYGKRWLNYSPLIS